MYKYLFYKSNKILINEIIIIGHLSDKNLLKSAFKRF